MKNHEMAVYQPKSRWQQLKDNVGNVALVVLTAAVSAPAFAGFDTTQVVEEIGSNKTGMTSVGLAILGLVALVVGFIMVKRMMR